jgi:hypothetical protein
MNFNETRVCKACDQELHISQFNVYPNGNISGVCNECSGHRAHFDLMNNPHIDGKIGFLPVRDGFRVVRAIVDVEHHETLSRFLWYVKNGAVITRFGQETVYLKDLVGLLHGYEISSHTIYNESKNKLDCRRANLHIETRRGDL